MSDILRALAISAGILFPVVVLIIIISIAAVRRGEAELHVASHGAAHTPQHAAETQTPPPSAKPAKPAAPAVEEISIAMILLLGVGLFTVTILVLLGVSLIAHAG